MEATLKNLAPSQVNEVKYLLESLPLSFKLFGFEKRPNKNRGASRSPAKDWDERFGFLDLESGFYAVVRHGHFNYDDPDHPYRWTSFKEEHTYLSRGVRYDRDSGEPVRSYLGTVENSREEDSCDCGSYIWDSGSIYGGYDPHGKILFVRKLLPFEIIELKFKLHRFSKRLKNTSPLSSNRPRS